jgi:hypothetical protein
LNADPIGDQLSSGLFPFADRACENFAKINSNDRTFLPGKQIEKP